MALEIPQINAEDLILVTTKYFAKIFYSDGRIAQTDLSIEDLDAELAAIPEEEGLRERVFEECKVHGEGHAKTMAEQSVTLTKRKILIDSKVAEGYLKDYIQVFKRDRERAEEKAYWGPALEGKILDEGPLTIFGCKMFDICDHNTLSIRFVKYKPKLWGQQFELVSVQPETAEETYIITRSSDLKAVYVGAEQIREVLQNTPGAQPYLDANFIPELKK